MGHDCVMKSEKNNNFGTPKPRTHVTLLVLTIATALGIPILLQSPLNILFRDLFNPPGWRILLPNLRVLSTLICFLITYVVGFIMLKKRDTKLSLFIIHAILTFLWCGFVALLLLPD